MKALALWMLDGYHGAKGFSRARVRERAGMEARHMGMRAVVPWKDTAAGVFVSCPVCGAGKLLRLYPGTRAEELPVYCRRCKRVSVFDVQAGERRDRVTLRRIG